MGRNEEVNQILRKKRMEEIEEGALYYFAKYGLRGAKISDLSKYLGISQGLIYRYYASKEELFKVVSSKWIQNRDTNFQGLVEAPISSVEKIKFLTKHVETSIRADKKFAAFFTIFENESLTSGTKEGTMFYDWSNEPITMLATIIRQGQENHEPIHEGDPFQMAVGYWGYVFAVSHNYISTDSLAWYDLNILNRMLIKNM
ncbi:MAG: TetR/AcrR family transcriptional regulator [Anaeroplasmataceae bacterium]|nr:TetR/AcrR family transcriptional regulator [Anaeroplasmataceae bacterium]